MLRDAPDPKTDRQRAIDCLMKDEGFGFLWAIPIMLLLMLGKVIMGGGI